MSISFGIYDIFAYAIPGFLYLYMFNNILRLSKLPHVEGLAAIDSTAALLLLFLAAYLAGHLMDFLSHRLWVRLWYRGHGEERAYSQFLETKPGRNVKYEPRQWTLLFSAIRHNDHETAEMIDKFKATSIMLRNVSFGFLLLGALEILRGFVSTFSWQALFLSIVFLLFSVIALRISDRFNLSFYKIIYQQALLYGRNLEEVLLAGRGSRTTGKPRAKS